MTDDEHQALVNQINALSLDFGTVIKANGQWLVDGERIGLGLPRIGTKGKAKGLVMWRDEVNIIEGQIIRR